MVLNPSSFIFKTMSKDKPKSPKSRPGNKRYALGKVRKESSPNSRLSLPVNMLLWQNLSCCEINLARNGRRERQECMDPMCIHVWSEGINRRVAEDNFFFFLMERFCCDKNLSIINCFFFHYFTYHWSEHPPTFLTPSSVMYLPSCLQEGWPARDMSQ